MTEEATTARSVTELTLEERVRVLEEQVRTLSDAVRALARGLEQIPSEEVRENQVTRAARLAHELLIAAGL